MATHAGKTISVAVDLDPNTDIADATAFAALTWVEVPGVGAFPDLGRNEAISTYNTFKKVEKGKGAPDFGGGDMEVKRISGNAGQIALRTAAAKNLHVAFKVVYDDDTGADTGDFPATTEYAKGVISGPRRAGGGDEDMLLDIYGLGFTQALTVEPAAIA